MALPVLSWFNRKTNLRVGDIMTRDFVYVKPNTSLETCAKKMVKKRVGSLVLKDGQKLSGIITERDILWAMTKKSKKDLKKIKAKQIAAKKITTIKPSADISQALTKMKKMKFKRLPVIINGNVVGLLTSKDLLRVSPVSYQELAEIMEIREEAEKLNRKSQSKKKSWIEEGICEGCSNFDVLYNINRKLLCESCKNKPL